MSGRKKRIGEVCLSCLLLAAVFLCPGVALGEEESPVTSQDDSWGASLRLCDLGYLSCPVLGRQGNLFAQALSAFCLANGLADDGAVPPLLFSQDAGPVNGLSAAQALPERPLVVGEATPWATVSPRLHVGSDYAITACATGVVFHLRCLSINNAAAMTPAGTWDETTLAALLSPDDALGAVPVTLTLGGEKIAASLSNGPADASGHRCCLYFTGALPRFNGIEDAAHAAALAYAAVQPTLPS